jgi:hypothetical protein
LVLVVAPRVQRVLSRVLLVLLARRGPPAWSQVALGPRVISVAIQQLVATQQPVAFQQLAAILLLVAIPQPVGLAVDRVVNGTSTRKTDRTYRQAPQLSPSSR